MILWVCGVQCLNLIRDPVEVAPVCRLCVKDPGRLGASAVFYIHMEFEIRLKLCGNSQHED